MPTPGDTCPILVTTRPSRIWRVAGLTLLGVVLALSFLAYLSPDMLLRWESLATLCGF